MYSALAARRAVCRRERLAPFRHRRRVLLGQAHAPTHPPPWIGVFCCASCTLPSHEAVYPNHVVLVAINKTQTLSEPPCGSPYFVCTSTPASLTITAAAVATQHVERGGQLLLCTSYSISHKKGCLIKTNGGSRCTIPALHFHLNGAPREASSIRPIRPSVPPCAPTHRYASHKGKQAHTPTPSTEAR